MARILADEGSLRSEPIIGRKLGEMVQVLMEADFGLTKDRRRSDNSGWYVSASSVRGRSLSTRRAILYCRLGDVMDVPDESFGKCEIGGRVGSTRLINQWSVHASSPNHQLSVL